MKKIKLITTLVPLSIIGSITPIVVSCSSTPYELKYGANIDCINKKDKDYVNLKKVQEQIKMKINVESQQTSIDVSSLNERIQSDVGVFQNIYFELVYYWSVTQNKTFTLKSWKSEIGTNSWSFVLNGKSYSNVQFQYEVNGENKIVLQYDDKSFESYTYKDCTPI